MPPKAPKRKSQPSNDMTRMMSSLPPAVQQQLMDLTTTMHNVHRDCEHQTATAETAARDIALLRRDLEDAVEQRVKLPTKHNRRRAEDVKIWTQPIPLFKMALFHISSRNQNNTP